MPVSEMPDEELADRRHRLARRESPRDAAGRHPVTGGQSAGLGLRHPAQPVIDRREQRAGRDDRQVVLQVDLVDLGGEQRRHRRGGRLGAVDQQRSAGRARGRAARDARAARPRARPASCARGSTRRPPGTASRGSRAARRPRPRARADAAARAARRGVVRASRVPARSSARAATRRATSADAALGVHSVPGVGEPGARGDVEQQLDLVGVDARGGAEASGVGQGDAAAREPAGRLLAQRVQQLGHRGEGAERAVAGAAIHEPCIGLADRLERGGWSGRRPARAPPADRTPATRFSCSITASHGAYRPDSSASRPGLLSDRRRGARPRPHRPELRASSCAAVGAPGRRELAGRGEQGERAAVEPLEGGLHRACGRAATRPGRRSPGCRARARRAPSPGARGPRRRAHAAGRRARGPTR